MTWHSNRFTLTDDHLRLLRHSNVMEDLSNVETGGAEIDRKRPYGNSDVPKDVAELLGWIQAGDDLPGDGLHDDLRRWCVELHKDTPIALQIVLSTGQFVPGIYERSNPYGKDWKMIERLTTEAPHPCDSVQWSPRGREGEDDVPCTRTDTHWQHQNWSYERRVNWDDAGAHTSGRNPDAGYRARMHWDEDYTCRRCGTREYWHYSTTPLEPDACSSCNFWLHIIAQPDDDPLRVIINGRHYQVGREQAAYGPRSGFQRTKQHIRFNNGRVIQNPNLWTQGNIPAEWRDLLPDNAVFVQADHR